MSDRPAAGETPQPDARGKRLDSWKEVAGYLNRHVTTVRRWERDEKLPVHRHLHAKIGSIYAYTTELDAWFDNRRQEAESIAPPLQQDARKAPRPPVPWLTAAAERPARFIGRDLELHRLQQLWDRAISGEQQTVFINGEPGVGKTRLVLQFGRSVAAHATVLLGRCDREALVAYAPWLSILQWLVRSTPAQTLRQLLAGSGATAELAQFIPDLASRIHVDRITGSATPEGRRYRLFEAASELLVAASQREPVLLVIEDLQWADRGTLLFLRHVLRSTRHAAICAVLTHREDAQEWPPDVRDLVDSLRDEEVRDRVRLHRLSSDEIHRMIEAWLGRHPPAALVAFVAKHAEGNPLFVTELLRHLEETQAIGRQEWWGAHAALADIGLPEGIRQLIGRRLERLNPTTRRLLTLGAVIGREFRLSLIETLANVDEDAVLDALDEALAAGVIVEEPGAPGHFSFSHTLIRESLYTSLTAARRVRLHHRIATALEQSPSASARPAELAYHFGQAATYRSAEKALAYAVAAGDADVKSLAFENAAHWYEVALRAIDFVGQLPDMAEVRADLHIKRGRACFAVGQWAQARSAFEEAANLLPATYAEARCELLVRLAETAFWLMDVPLLRTYASEAESLAGRLGRDDLWADAHAWSASAMVSDGDVLQAVEMDREAVARAGGIRSFGLARTPLTLYWAGHIDEAEARARQAVERARTSDDAAFLLYALQHLGLTLSGAGRYDEALSVFDEARAFGRRCGALPLLARAISMSVAPLMNLSDLNGAMDRALEARQLAQRLAFEPPYVSAGIDLLLIHARRQDPGRAETLLEETTRAVQHATGWHGWKWDIRLSQARAELALARGDWSEAERAATHVVDRSRAFHRLKYEALGLASRARAVARRDHQAASKAAKAAAKVARRLGDPAVLLEALIAHLDVDGSDTLLAEARRTSDALLAGVSDASLRRALIGTIQQKAPTVFAGPPGRRV